MFLISLFWCKTCIEPSKKATGNRRRHHYSFPVEKGTVWSKCCSQRSCKKCVFPSKLSETPRLLALLSLLPNIGRVSCAMLWWSCFTKVFRIMSSKSSISCALIRKRSFSSCVSSMRDAWATTAVLNMFQCETPPTFLTAKIQWTEALFQQRSSQILEVATLELHWPWWPINAETQLLRVGCLRLPYLYLRAQDKSIRQHSVLIVFRMFWGTIIRSKKWRRSLSTNFSPSTSICSSLTCNFIAPIPPKCTKLRFQGRS